MKNPDRIKRLFIHDLLGYVAMWATRQSPYHAPDGLTDVLAEFKRRIEASREDFLAPTKALLGRSVFDYPDTLPATKAFLLPLLQQHLLTLPQVQKWNERKNGNQSPYGFCSRYDKPEPDNDFIDLDALAGNIVRSCIEHEEAAWRKNREDFRWTWRRVVAHIRCRWQYVWSKPRSPVAAEGVQPR